MHWLDQTGLESKDLFLVTRLIDQSDIIDQISREYIKACRGRVIPYRGTSSVHESSLRERSFDELHVKLAFDALEGSD